LDYNWADEQIAEISKKYVENPGNKDGGGGMGGMIAELPIAMAFGAMISDNLNFGKGNQLGSSVAAFGNKFNTPE
jgi:hypothetical protein